MGDSRDGYYWRLTMLDKPSGHLGNPSCDGGKEVDGILIEFASVGLNRGSSGVKA